MVPLTLCGNGSYLSMRNGARTVDSRANVVRKVLRSLLRLSIGDDRTAISSWFQFCRSVLVGSTNSGSGEREDDNGSDDDNDNGNNGGATKTARGNAKTRSGWGGLNDEDAQYGAWCAISNAEARWQTKICALELLRDILCTLKSTGEHIDLGLARKIQKHKQKPFCLVAKLESFLSVACSLAGGLVMGSPLPELQVAGLKLLHDIVHVFGPRADPDLKGNSLLKQYEMALNAAVRPCIASGNAPSVIVHACEVASQIIVTGVSDSVRRVLATLLEDIEGNNVRKLRNAKSSEHFGREAVELAGHIKVSLTLARLKALSAIYLASQGVRGDETEELPPWGILRRIEFRARERHSSGLIFPSRGSNLALDSGRQGSHVHLSET